MSSVELEIAMEIADRLMVVIVSWSVSDETVPNSTQNEKQKRISVLAVVNSTIC